MMAVGLQDAITIRGRFHRSVQLARDWREGRGLQEYLLTPTARDLVVQILSSLRIDRGARAWSITGPYGAGKSAFALFLTDVLARQSPMHPDTLTLRQEVGFVAPPFLPVLAAGQRSPIIPLLLSTLAQSMRSLAPIFAKTLDDLRGREDFSARAVADLYEQAAQIACEAGQGGLLVILDEFGKVLEHAALHPDEVDLHVMQELAEAASRSAAPIVFITILHASFADYLLGVDELQRVEWQKVQGRFIDVAFREPAEQVLHLISLAIEAHFQPDMAAAYRQAISAVIDDPALSESRRRMPLEVLIDCTPLHPVTVLLLPPLFRSKLAQNERSLFAFLSAQEPFGLQEFLANATWEGGRPPLCEVDVLYDYVTAALGTTTYLGDRAHRWGEIGNALDRIPPDAPHLAARVVKAVALLGLYGSQVGLKASPEVLRLAFSDRDAVREALEYLRKISVVVYRRHQQAFALWEGSDVDLESCLEEARQKVGQGSLARRLRAVLSEDRSADSQKGGIRPIVARSHYIRTGTLRYFSLDIIDGTADALREALSAPLISGNGQILYVLARSQRDRTNLMNLACELTSNDDTERRLRVLAFPRPIRGLEEAVETIEAWSWVQENTPALQGDPVARQEVRTRLLFARDWLQTAAGQVLGLRGHQFDAAASEWIYAGQLQRPRCGKQQLVWLSELCDHAFDQAPLIHNELLNRDRLSSAAAKARRNLLDAMLKHEREPNLGLTGFPPEVSMYRSLLLEGGFHQSDGGEWGFGIPRQSWNAVWQAIEIFLSTTAERPRPFTELIAALRLPPFGLREGPIPLVVCSAFLALRDEVALYEDDVFVPELRIEVFERLTRVPEAFAVRRLAFSPQEETAISQLGDTIRLLGIPVEKRARTSLLDVIKPLVLFAVNLPAYTRNTRRLDPSHAAAVRDALLRTRDPYALFAVELPTAVGMTVPLNGDSPALTDALGECILGLQQAYDRLLADLQGQIAQAFDLSGTSQEMAAQLQARATPLLGHTADRTLNVFVREASRLGGRDWSDVLGRVVNGGLPPAQWHDADVAAFGPRVRSLASDFVRLEELAAEQRSSGASEILRIGVLDGRAQESRAVVAVTPDRAEKVRSLVEQLLEVLEGEADESDEGRRICLAALARVAAQYLKPGEDLPRG